MFTLVCFPFLSRANRLVIPQSSRSWNSLTLSILELDVLLNVKTGPGNRNRIPHEHSECRVQMRGTSSAASVKRENDMVKVLTF
jgi:hypothetical protein